MGTIKLNPDKLKKKIKGLRDKSDEAGRARANIDTESKELGDPSPSKAVYTFHINSATHINNVRACADRIESEMNRIIELNQNGIATMNGGTITVENVPDTVLKGGKNEFDTWSQGALDAKDLQAITQGKKPKSNRTYDDVMASIQANLVSESYSTGFIETVGVENLTQLPLDVATSFTRKKKAATTNLIIIQDRRQTIRLRHCLVNCWLTHQEPGMTRSHRMQPIKSPLQLTKRDTTVE